MSRSKRDEKLPQFTPMLHCTMDEPAWLALSPAAKAQYPAAKRLAGYSGDKNGDFFMSVRYSAANLDVTKDTASRAFRELQEKGFLQATRVGSLGIAGEGRATKWRLTELGTRHNRRPTKEFKEWKPGSDFAVARGKAPA